MSMVCTTLYFLNNELFFVEAFIPYSRRGIHRFSSRIIASCFSNNNFPTQSSYWSTTHASPCTEATSCSTTTRHRWKSRKSSVHHSMWWSLIRPSSLTNVWPKQLWRWGTSPKALWYCAQVCYHHRSQSQSVKFETCCPGATMEELASRVLQLKICSFQPKHKNNLANDFRCYANYCFDDEVSKNQSSKWLKLEYTNF